MKRTILVLSALLLAATLTPATASAQTFNRAAFDRQVLAANRAAATDQTAVRATLADLRNLVVGMSTGPNERTGYGQATVDAIVKGCPECDWYRPDMTITNHQPDCTICAPTKMHAQRAALGGFCWPWEQLPWSGCSGWNTPSTWNWPGIWGTINGDWHPWDTQSTVDRFEGCIQGSVHSLTIGVFAKIGWDKFMTATGIIKVTPGGAAYTAAGGCISSFWHWPW